jgi:hypothetical protein
MRASAFVICGLILVAAFAITLMNGANARDHQQRAPASQPLN